MGEKVEYSTLIILIVYVILFIIIAIIIYQQVLYYIAIVNADVQTFQTQLNQIQYEIQEIKNIISPFGPRRTISV
jgi:hypothetical protein